jgi:hypothetical protein
MISVWPRTAICELDWAGGSLTKSQAVVALGEKNEAAF